MALRTTGLPAAPPVAKLHVAAREKPVARPRSLGCAVSSARTPLDHSRNVRPHPSSPNCNTADRQEDLLPGVLGNARDLMPSRKN